MRTNAPVHQVDATNVAYERAIKVPINPWSYFYIRRVSPQRARRLAIRASTFVVCFLLQSVGFIGADLYTSIWRYEVSFEYTAFAN